LRDRFRRSANARRRESETVTFFPPLERYPRERALGVHPAVDARRSEKDDGVLDVLGLEPTKGLQVLGEDADRARLVAFEKLEAVVRQRLMFGHWNPWLKLYHPHRRSKAGGIEACEFARSRCG
jgi:hypothetical protein